jgi:magnesium chelatase subunit D
MVGITLLNLRFAKTSMVELGQVNKSSRGRRRSASFGEIVGQDGLKQALLAVAAADGLDGLLVQGEKGTAKSTAVRALSELLPDQRAVADCPYGCPPDAPGRQCSDCRSRADPPTTERPVPLVTLPLGATRERVVGTLSVADALDGDHEFDPGLLARANRGILYVDEVNLLDDHLVDVLLDAAASGRNRVERDGVSVSHPAAFTLVGTMNPEEGELRPQLRDRFALGTCVTGCDDLDRRVESVDRALGRTDLDTREADRERTRDARDRLRSARERLGGVDLPAEFVEEIAELCRDAGVDGHRADIATARAARAFAALDGRPKVVESDVKRAAEFTLPHRLRSRPFEDAPDAAELLDGRFGDADDAGNGGKSDDPDGAGGESADGGGDSSSDAGDGRGAESGRESGERGTDGTGDPGTGEGGPGPGSRQPGGSADGVGGAGDAGDSSADGTSVDPTDPGDDSAEPGPPAGNGGTGPADAEADGDSGDGTDGESDGEEPATPLVPGEARAGVGDADGLALSTSEAGGHRIGGDGSRSRVEPSVDGRGARVRTRPADGSGGIDAAASVRAASGRGADRVESRDLRRSVRRRETSALVLFVVDASASMRPAMRAAKGTVLELLKDAYRERDEVGFVTFAGDGADVLLPPTDSVSLAARHLKELPTGDRTPLPAGLRTARRVLDSADPAASVVVLVTDGRENVAEGSPVEATREASRALADVGTEVVAVDAGDGGRAGVVGTVVEETGGERVPLDALSAERVDDAAGEAKES